jgi:hypothetical protein
MAKILKDSKKSLEFVYDFYLKMKRNNINLAYEGEITHQITKAFSSLPENNMIRAEAYSSVQKIGFRVMVECLQNISKHADNQFNYISSKDGRGIFLVSKDETEYNVTTGNVVKNEKIDELKQMLEHINQLDKQELNKLYKQKIKEGRLSEKGGAGLGFIDIARKTGQKLVYSFIKIDEEKSFFVLTSTISRLKQKK